jgi:hypothetical protein
MENIEIEKHKKIHKCDNLELKTLEEYKWSLNSEAFFFVDHHGFLCGSLSGEMLAANREQLNVMIEYLNGLRTDINR